MKEIEKLINEIKEITPATVSNDNIFSILGVEHKEVFHSRFLRYLLETYPIFSKHFLSTEEKIVPICEYPCDNMKGCPKEVDGRIDIFFKTSNKAVAIEVKWFADDQPQQLLRYYDHLKDRFPNTEIHMFYLTINGKAPSENSISCSACDRKCKKPPIADGIITNISFDNIKEWLNEIEPKDTIIRYYIEILEAEVKDSIREQLDKRENFATALQIHSRMKDIISDILKSFVNTVNGAAQREKTEAVLAFGGENLYCHIKGNEEQWCYVTSEWFENDKAEPYSKDLSKAIPKNLYGDNNPIVRWHFSDKEEQRSAVNHIVSNMKLFHQKNQK